MKINIKESDLERIVRRVVEDVESEKDETENIDLKDYDESDFHEVFFLHFRPWVLKNYGEEISKYPMSYLMSKYGLRFAAEIDPQTWGRRLVDVDDDDHEWSRAIRRYDISNIGQAIVKKKLHKLPGLYSKKKFTERYAKILPDVFKRLEIPDYLTYEVRETTPNKVRIVLKSDFGQRVKSKIRQPRPHDLTSKFKKFFRDFIGVKFGNPAYGEVDLEFRGIDTIGAEEWKKNILQKEIRPKIKLLDKNKFLHSIRLTISDQSEPELRMSFKDNAPWNYRNTLRTEVKNLMSELGYNLKIDFN